MARSIAFVPTTSSSVTALVALEDIPQDVREEVEQAYTALKSGAVGRFRAKFDSPEELRVYVTQVTSYCEQRPEGAIRFRKSPSKGLPPNVMDFRITDLLTPNEVITQDIREATATANAASGAVPSETAKPAGRRK